MGMSENSSSPTNMVDVLTRANLQKIAQFLEKVAKTTVLATFLLSYRAQNYHNIYWIWKFNDFCYLKVPGFESVLGENE